MSRGRSETRVVAELGRPETPEETAARKAQNSYNHRIRQTPNNLVLSLIATVALVVVIVLVVPRGDGSPRPGVDFAAVAAQAQPSVTEQLAVPEVPADWDANLAQLRRGADGVQSWYIGLLTPSEEYIGLSQGFDANESWLAAQLGGVPATGAETIDGVSWSVYDNREASGGTGNVQFALSTTSGASTYVLYGTAGDTEFRTVASGLAEQIESEEEEHLR